MKQLIEQMKTKQSLLYVGLDTDITKIPRHLLTEEDPLFAFNKAIIEAAHPFAVAYKPNVVFYEAHDEKGWRSLKKTISYLNTFHPEISTIADAKRDDIGSTATMYARTFFEDMQFNSVTVAPYMGRGSVEPFLAFESKNTILLTLTSSEGAFDFQTQEIGGETFYKKVLRTSFNRRNGQQLMYIVGATRTEYLREIRQIVPNHFLLVSEVGTQGGSSEEVCHYGLNDQCGLLINSSRGVIYTSKGKDFTIITAEKAQELRGEMKKLMINIYQFPRLLVNMITLLTREMITREIEQNAHRLFSMPSRHRQQALSELFEDENIAPYVVDYIKYGRLHGMASMAVYKVISGYKDWMEDVVVDEFARGKKIGTQLVQTLISRGGELGLGEILLFTAPTNKAAMRLYENEGFKREGIEVSVDALKEMYSPVVWY